ncbi:S1C family serine protease [Kineococcus sp. SYSU DK004]|uniref:S1C family serine protease n=1 Tax=Kineococcus sp. SYSU DK004 TaxID=3383125 RepID=UPI003D7C4189
MATVRAGRGDRARTAAWLLLPVVLAGCTAGGGDAAEPGAASAETSTASSSPSSSSPSGGSQVQVLEDAYQQVIADVLPSVVEIRTSTGLGSGVVLDEEGNIVTNAHVVGQETEFQVTFATSPTSYPGTLVGTYPENDLAVVNVQGAPDLRPAELGDSDAVEVGDLVLAMGNPLGLSSSVTNGIVSATGRTVTEPPSEAVPAGAVLPGTIQTSAAINPGNSGGALVDMDGQVVGIPTLAATNASQDGNAPAPGIGFAIPANTAADIAEQLVRDGEVTSTNRAALGVTVTTVADPSGQPAGAGVVAVEPGGGAEAAGLRPGDVITQVDGQEIRSTAGLSTVLADLEVGQTVDVTVLRDGDEQTLSVTLGELPAG